MAQIKPAEVSAILRQQLAGFKDEKRSKKLVLYDRRRRHLAVYGMSNAQAGELVNLKRPV